MPGSGGSSPTDPASQELLRDLVPRRVLGRRGPRGRRGDVLQLAPIGSGRRPGPEDRLPIPELNWDAQRGSEISATGWTSQRPRSVPTAISVDPKGRVQGVSAAPSGDTNMRELSGTRGTAASSAPWQNVSTGHQVRPGQSPVASYRSRSATMFDDRQRLLELQASRAASCEPSHHNNASKIA